MRALVTGGAGFIGSHLADALLEDGAEVIILDNLTTGFAENVPDATTFVKGDITDAETVARAMAGCDVVFHLAAARAVQLSVEQPVETDRVNVGGTVNVLHAARDAGVRRVVAASSSSVYGGAAPVPTPESAPLRPRSPYAVSKLALELYCDVFCELYGLETVVLRFFNGFGPRQRPDSMYAAVIPLFIDALRSGKRPVVHGDGGQSRDFTYVTDVVAANLAAASAPSERCAGNVYNVAQGGTTTVLGLLAALADILGVEADPQHLDPRPGDVRLSRADISNARRDLGYAPSVAFEEGLARTVSWFTSKDRQ